MKKPEDVDTPALAIKPAGENLTPREVLDQDELKDEFIAIRKSGETRKSTY